MLREKLAMDFRHSIEQGLPSFLTPPAQPPSNEEILAPGCREHADEIVGEVDWSNSCYLRKASRMWSPGLLIPAPKFYLLAQKQIHI